MERFLQKKKELKEKYKDVPRTYKWYLQNKCDIFNDLITLKELLEQTEEYKQYVEDKMLDPQKTKGNKINFME